MHRAVEVAAAGLEAFAVGVIVISFIFATLRFLLQLWQKSDAAFANYKLMLGRAMLLGLEFLVAADVIRTVALAPTLANIEILAGLVLMRTFLSWSLVVELEGHWPWRSAAVAAQSEHEEEHDARRPVLPGVSKIDKPSRVVTAVPVPHGKREGDNVALATKVNVL